MTAICTHPYDGGNSSADWSMRNFRNVTVEAGNNCSFLQNRRVILDKVGDDLAGAKANTSQRLAGATQALQGTPCRVASRPDSRRLECGVRPEHPGASHPVPAAADGGNVCAPVQVPRCALRPVRARLHARQVVRGRLTIRP